MFSGLTNQVSSWMGKTDEDVPPNSEAAQQAPPTAETQVIPEEAAGDPNAEGEAGKAGMFSNVKGWLGNASASIPSMPAMPAMPSMPAMAMPSMPAMPSIPGLRKGNTTDVAEGGDAAAQAEQSAAEGGISNAGLDEDDKSRYISATEGADSHPASGDEGLTDEGQIGQVTTKVTQGAKHFGFFLSSAIKGAGEKITQTVKNNPIYEFNKEQEAFIKGQGGKADGAAPWVGHSNEAKIKEEILGLSQDRRNFVRAPPAGVDFPFDYDSVYPTAISIMAEDKALEQMRFDLVPKIITEENFWRNYFYRVSLIIQAAELGTLGADGVGAASSEDVKEKVKEVQQTETNSPKNPKTNEKNSKKSKKNSKTQKEFVSDDDFQTAETLNLAAELKISDRKLGIDSMTQQALESNEEQWEKDLEAELQEYEVVNNGAGAVASTTEEDDDEATASTITTTIKRNRESDWEQYADLIDETDDLK